MTANNRLTNCSLIFAATTGLSFAIALFQKCPDSGWSLLLLVLGLNVFAGVFHWIGAEDSNVKLAILERQLRDANSHIESLNDLLVQAKSAKSPASTAYDDSYDVEMREKYFAYRCKAMRGQLTKQERLVELRKLLEEFNVLLNAENRRPGDLTALYDWESLGQEFDDIWHELAERESREHEMTQKAETHPPQQLPPIGYVVVYLKSIGDRPHEEGAKYFSCEAGRDVSTVLAWINKLQEECDYHGLGLKVHLYEAHEEVVLMSRTKEVMPPTHAPRRVKCWTLAGCTDVDPRD